MANRLSVTVSIAAEIIGISKEIFLVIRVLVFASLGITLENARRLVVRGFFNEIVTEIGIESIQDRLMDRIDGELAKAGA
jgi:hypothetical protein